MNITQICKYLVSITNDRSFLELSKGKIVSVNGMDRAMSTTLVNDDISVSKATAQIKISPENYFQRTQNDSFDVVLYEYKRDTEIEVRDGLNSALKLVKPNGFLVFRNAKPKAEYQQLDRKDFLALTDRPNNSWTGPVWKYVATIKNNNNFKIFTVDCDWGVAVIQRTDCCETYESQECPTYEDFSNDIAFHLNLISPKAFLEWVFEQKKRSMPSIYTVNPQSDLEKTAYNYHFKITPTVTYVDDGFVLPIRRFNNIKCISFFHEGGVCDQSGEFIAGFDSALIGKNKNLSCIRGYEFDKSKAECFDEEILYLGFIPFHFGHFLIDGLSRWWWLANNLDFSGKVVFSGLEYDSNESIIKIAEDFLRILGISKEQILIIDKPTRFRKIIIPSQTAYRLDAYTERFLDIYNAVSERVVSKKYEKVYLTRTNFSANIKPNSYGEIYFENFYRERGYEIVAPETLSIEEQIACVASAKEMVCVDGTLCLHGLFMLDNAKFTILARGTNFYSPHFHILEQKGIQVTYVDISKNFLPVEHGRGPFLLSPTKQWFEYVAEVFGETLPTDCDDLFEKHIVEFLTYWVKIYRGDFFEKWLAKKDVSDILEALSLYFSEKPINKQDYKKKLGG